jgi:hypothetical protein
MSQLFDRAIERLRNLSPEAQDEIARLLLQLTTEGEAPAIPMTDEEEASFDESFAQAERGEFASEEQVRAVWAKHGL